MSTHRSTTERARDLVVVVHGIGGKRLWMALLCWRLRSRGFRAVNWGYPSLLGDIEKHAARLRDYLTDDLTHETRVHIVAHSMGSIVVRAALAKGTISNLGRVVLFAPPNHGTPVARYTGLILGRFCKAFTDLSDHPDSYVNKLPTFHSLDVTAVAARFDVLVPEASTHLSDEREHVVLGTTHNGLLLSRRAADLAGNFLETGRF